MNITSKSRYALKIMIDLALNDGNGLQQRQNIAKRQGIPSDYIDHILARLRDHDLITSVRGRSGGFVLGRPSEEISAWDIFKAVEETVYPVQCLDESGCLHQDLCLSKPVWDDIFSGIENQLKEKSLKHLVRLARHSKGDDLIPMIQEPVGTIECRSPKKA
jgi:Rrf2 family protein